LRKFSVDVGGSSQPGKELWTALGFYFRDPVLTTSLAERHVADGHEEKDEQDNQAMLGI
jgi:hypothetical protein